MIKLSALTGTIVWHGSDILALRQNFVVGHKKWIFVYRIPCWINKAAKKEGPP